MARRSYSGGEFSTSTQMFTCTGFADALAAATDETIDDVRSAIRSSLNKVTRSIKTLTSSEIRKIYNVPAAVLNDRLTVFSARIHNLEAELVVGGRSIPLSYFGMRAASGTRRMSVSLEKGKRGIRGKLKTSTTKRRSAGMVSFEVIKGKRTTMKSAFVAVMKSGHIGVMQRGKGVIKKRAQMKGIKHRQALYEHSVISIASMFERAEVNDAVVALVDTMLASQFDAELNYYLNVRNK